MNARFNITFAAAALCAAGFAPRMLAAKVSADIVAPQRREMVVEAAERLTQRPAPAPVAADIPNPFNPATFDQPDPDAPKPAPSGTAPRGGAPAVAQPTRPPGDREILETLAARLTPSGMFERAGKPLLVIGRDRFEPGTKFIVTYNEQDYELELVTIDRTNFTLRYRGEEMTRPIKPVK